MTRRASTPCSISWRPKIEVPLSSESRVLLSGTSIFGRQLIEQGVDARLVIFDGLPHAFWAYMDIPEAAQANALMAKFFKDRLAVAQ